MHESDRIKFMAATLSCIGDGIIITDADGIVLYINASGEMLTGWREQTRLKALRRGVCAGGFLFGKATGQPIGQRWKKG
jgi:PAS domain-containing protein